MELEREIIIIVTVILLIIAGVWFILQCQIDELVRMDRERRKIYGGKK
jgi:hypothetical protein